MFRMTELVSSPFLHKGGVVRGYYIIIIEKNIFILLFIRNNMFSFILLHSYFLGFFLLSIKNSFISLNFGASLLPGVPHCFLIFI